MDPLLQALFLERHQEAPQDQSLEGRHQLPCLVHPLQGSSLARLQLKKVPQLPQSLGYNQQLSRVVHQFSVVPIMPHRLVHLQRLLPSCQTTLHYSEARNPSSNLRVQARVMVITRKTTTMVTSTSLTTILTREQWLKRS